MMDSSFNYFLQLVGSIVVIIINMVLLITYLRSLYQRNKRRQTELLHDLRENRALPAEVDHAAQRNKRAGTQHIMQSSSRANTDKAQVISKQVKQALAHRGLIRVLYVHPDALVTMLYHRAITLYQEQQGITWQEARSAIDELVSSLSDKHDGQPASLSSGADPMVTVLLLQADCREDAITYFCQSTGADIGEATAAINYLQSLIDTGNTLFLEHQKRTPDPAVIQFLLQAGYKLLAIRYYRDCTDVGLTTAKTAIEQTFSAISDSDQASSINQ